MLLSSETTAKGTGLEKSAGKEDPDDITISLLNGVNSGRQSHIDTTSRAQLDVDTV